MSNATPPSLIGPSPVSTAPPSASVACAAQGPGRLAVAARRGSAKIRLIQYQDERQLPFVQKLIDGDLSEPYSIFTYRYFLTQWPQLCFLAVDIDTEAIIGAIVCKLDTRPKPHRPARLPSPTYVSRRPVVFPSFPGGPSPLPPPLPPPETPPYLRGYIAMLAVATSHRRSGTGTALATRAMQAMVDAGAAEAVLEAEACNERALGLYENLGFMRTKRLEGYYLNGSDAFRLVARLPRPPDENAVQP
ncbi:hypothetical protein MMPV_003170 [Pyropia vietnamensis]